jgi:hypothetical protein
MGTGGAVHFELLGALETVFRISEVFIQIRTLLYSSVAFKRPTKITVSFYSISLLIPACRYIYFSFKDNKIGTVPY